MNLNDGVISSFGLYDWVVHVFFIDFVLLRFIE